MSEGNQAIISALTVSAVQNCFAPLSPIRSVCAGMPTWCSKCVLAWQMGGLECEAPAKGRSRTVAIRSLCVYHCHHKHDGPDRILSESFPALLDRIITGNYSKRIDLIIFRAHCRKHPAGHRSDDTRTEIPCIKSCNELLDEISPILNSVFFDRNFTGENSQRIDLAMISVTIVGKVNEVASLRQRAIVPEVGLRRERGREIERERERER